MDRSRPIFSQGPGGHREKIGNKNNGTSFYVFSRGRHKLEPSTADVESVSQVEPESQPRVVQRKCEGGVELECATSKKDLVAKKESHSSADHLIHHKSAARTLELAVSGDESRELACSRKLSESPVRDEDIAASLVSPSCTARQSPRWADIQLLSVGERPCQLRTFHVTTKTRGCVKDGKRSSTPQIVCILLVKV